VTRPEAMVAVVPARDEEGSLARCLTALLASARAAGIPAGVVVVAHRCTDATAAVAARLLRPGDALVVDDRSLTVAGARAAGAAAALGHAALLGAAPARTWLLSTDADSLVPRGWFAAIAAHATAGAAAVAGLVDVRHDPGMPRQARRAYRNLVAAGVGHREHRHVYGANLAVRADAYLGVGGWPDVTPGEDHALVAALRAAGHPVTTALDDVVRTSGRHRPRAAGGLGELLRALARQSVAGYK
jgi:hypothetical protein